MMSLQHKVYGPSGSVAILFKKISKLKVNLEKNNAAKTRTTNYCEMY